MVKWMERSEERRRGEIGAIAAAQERTSTALRDALALVTTRMDSMERVLAQGGGAGVREAIAQLEARIDRLDRQEAAGVVPARIETALRDLEARLVAVADRMDPATPVLEQAERIRTIETALAGILERLDAAPEAESLSRGPSATPRSLDEAMAEIRAARRPSTPRASHAPLRRRRGRGTGPRRRRRRGRPCRGVLPRRPRPSDATHRRTARSRRPQRQPAGRGAHRDIATLRGDLADLTAAVKALAPQPRLAAIEASLGDLAGRLAGLRDDLGQERERAGDTGPIDALGAELGRIGQALQPLQGLAELRADIAALAGRLDRAEAQDDTAASPS